MQENRVVFLPILNKTYKQQPEGRKVIRTIPQVFSFPLVLQYKKLFRSFYQ